MPARPIDRSRALGQIAKYCARALRLPWITGLAPKLTRYVNGDPKAVVERVNNTVYRNRQTIEGQISDVGSRENTEDETESLSATSLYPSQAKTIPRGLRRWVVRTSRQPFRARSSEAVTYLRSYPHALWLAARMPGHPSSQSPRFSIMLSLINSLLSSIRHYSLKQLVQLQFSY